MNGKKLYNMLSDCDGINELVHGNKPTEFFAALDGIIPEDIAKMNSLDLGEYFLMDDCETIFIRTV